MKFRCVSCKEVIELTVRELKFSNTKCPECKECEGFSLLSQS